LHIIQEDPTYFYTGRLSDGKQALLVLRWPNIVTVQFDKEGDLVEACETPIPQSFRELVNEHDLVGAFRRSDDGVFSAHLAGRGFVRGAIQVKRFFLPQWRIGISEFSDGLREILENPSEFSADEQRIAESEKKRWAEEGMFQLWLNPGSYRWINELFQPHWHKPGSVASNFLPLG
jgi:hypothetical protein